MLLESSIATAFSGKNVQKVVNGKVLCVGNETLQDSETTEKLMCLSFSTGKTKIVVPVFVHFIYSISNTEDCRLLKVVRFKSM